MAGKKRRLGDRRDGRWVKDATGLQVIMANLMPNRVDCEVYLHDTIDATELMKYLAEKNKGLGTAAAQGSDGTAAPERTDDSAAAVKTTIFHCAVAAIARMVHERPLMNRFVQGGRIYERDEISISFVAKRRFADGAEETLMFYTPKLTDTIAEISKRIVGDVSRERRSEHSTGGVDQLMDRVAALPRPFIMGITYAARVMDYWGVNPEFLTSGDPNYSTVLVSNLGSIKCPAVYHHLNNYGTNSILVTIGELHKEEVLMPDGTKEIRDVVDIGATLDERIADGFYFAKSLKLIRYMFAHPELFDRPIGEASGFEYR